MRIIRTTGNVIDCHKIEPATLKPGYIIVDEEFVIALDTIIKIIG